ncbi:hypothetical protein BH11PAT2_BH11PAT2_07330 [soil metagenome]
MTQHLYLLSDLRVRADLNAILGIDPELQSCRDHVNAGNYAAAITSLTSLLFGNELSGRSDEACKTALREVWEAIKAAFSEDSVYRIISHCDEIKGAAEREVYNPRRFEGLLRLTTGRIVSEERALCRSSYTLGRLSFWVEYLCSTNAPPLTEELLQDIADQLMV